LLEEEHRACRKEPAIVPGKGLQSSNSTENEQSLEIETFGGGGVDMSIQHIVPVSSKEKLAEKPYIGQFGARKKKKRIGPR